MIEAYSDYRMLLNSFIDNEISAEEFQHTYLERFKNEKRNLDEPLFELLDELFGDVDMFCIDQELLTVSPELYLDETALRDKTTQKLKQLIQLQSKRSAPSAPSEK